MYEFLILGQVPGTDIKVTFELYIVFVLSMTAVILTVYELRRLNVLKRFNKQTIKLGLLVRTLILNRQNALPPKLQLFK